MEENRAAQPLPGSLGEIALFYAMVSLTVFVALQFNGAWLLVPALMAEAMITDRRYQRLSGGRANLASSIRLLTTQTLARLIFAFLWLSGLLALAMFAASIGADPDRLADGSPASPDQLRDALGTGGLMIVLILVGVVAAFLHYADRRLFYAAPMTASEGRVQVLASWRQSKVQPVRLEALDWIKRYAPLVVALTGLVSALNLAPGSLPAFALIAVTFGISGALGAIWGPQLRLTALHGAEKNA